MELSEQEQIGNAIANLKDLYPNMSACERADLVLSNKFFVSAISTNGSYKVDGSNQ